MQMLLPWVQQEFETGVMKYEGRIKYVYISLNNYMGKTLIIVLTIELEELFFYELFPQVLHLDLVFTDTVSINDNKDSIYILLW